MVDLPFRPHRRWVHFQSSKGLDGSGARLWYDLNHDPDTAKKKKLYGTLVEEPTAP